jgi:hypothetical protein
MARLFNKIFKGLSMRPQASAPSDAVLGDVYCDTTGKIKKYNGSAWVEVGGDSLPVQTGNSGKYLTTNGTTTSWGTVATSTDNLLGLIHPKLLFPTYENGDVVESCRRWSLGSGRGCPDGRVSYAWTNVPDDTVVP